MTIKNKTSQRSYELISGIIHQMEPFLQMSSKYTQTQSDAEGELKAYWRSHYFIHNSYNTWVYLFC